MLGSIVQYSIPDDHRFLSEKNAGFVTVVWWNGASGVQEHMIHTNNSNDPRHQEVTVKEGMHLCMEESMNYSLSLCRLKYMLAACILALKGADISLSLFSPLGCQYVDRGIQFCGFNVDVHMLA